MNHVGKSTDMGTIAWQWCPSDLPKMYKGGAALVTRSARWDQYGGDDPLDDQWHWVKNLSIVSREGAPMHDMGDPNMRRFLGETNRVRLWQFLRANSDLSVSYVAARPLYAHDRPVTKEFVRQCAGPWHQKSRKVVRYAHLIDQIIDAIAHGISGQDIVRITQIPSRYVLRQILKFHGYENIAHVRDIHGIPKTGPPPALAEHGPTFDLDMLREEWYNTLPQDRQALALKYGIEHDSLLYYIYGRTSWRPNYLQGE